MKSEGKGLLQFLKLWPKVWKFHPFGSIRDVLIIESYARFPWI
jgi:hypothetical protein